MNKNISLPVTLLGVLLFAFSAAHAKDNIKTEEDLSEYNAALKLAPDLDNGRELYKMCVACHGPEGWGSRNGSYPQIAGQLPGVSIKQLADIRAGNRDNPIMRAFTTVKVLNGAQDIADVAGYVAALPMSANNGQGNKRYLEQGKEIFLRDCADCHGNKGEGNSKKHVPMIQGQHYQYLLRQYRWIRDGRRRNADKNMVEQIQGYSLRDEKAVLAYTASLKPPEEKRAKPGWQNPDFPRYHRGWQPEPAPERR
ncbi:MAG: c-type cytochrome [Proteobacteria bacterium]|nr:c-type cytochrome [Pseudomonadota bacterium]